MNFAAPLAPAAQDFREMVVAEALRAAETAQHVNMRIAGDDLRLDVADPGLGAALLPAIRHHEIPAAATPAPRQRDCLWRTRRPPARPGNRRADHGDDPRIVDGSARRDPQRSGQGIGGQRRQYSHGAG